MEWSLRRSKLDWERLENPGITAWNISHSLHAFGVFFQLFIFPLRPSNPVCVKWVSIPVDLGDLDNYCSHVQPKCSDPYPVLHDIIPYQLLLISCFLSLLASFRHIQILRLLHQICCDPLPPDTDWGKLGTKSPLCVRWLFVVVLSCWFI